MSQIHADRRIAELAVQQHGVVARHQLLDAGLGPSDVDHRVARGGLHVIHLGVYAPGHPVLTPHGRRMAAALACGRGAVLSHQSAAELHGLLRHHGSRVHVAVDDRSGRRRPGISIHRPRTLLDDEKTRVDRIPVTTVERTLLDLAAVVGRSRLERACDEAERNAVVDWATALLLIDRHRRHPGTRRLHRVLLAHGIAEDQTRSRHEREFRALLEAHGLPRPEINVQVEGHLVDAVWEDERLIVEVDPPEFHRTVFRIEAEKRRDTALTVAGWRVIRLSDRRILEESDAVAAELRRLLRRPAAAAQTTRSSRGFGLRSRPTLALGRPSASTMSAVKSLAPRSSDDPTP